MRPRTKIISSAVETSELVVEDHQSDDRMKFVVGNMLIEFEELKRGRDLVGHSEYM